MYTVQTHTFTDIWTHNSYPNAIYPAKIHENFVNYFLKIKVKKCISKGPRKSISKLVG